MKLKSPKAKGNTFERELVEEFKSYGFDAKRAWGSNGQAMGEHEEVDILIEGKLSPINHSGGWGGTGLPRLKLQCKRRGKLPSYLGLTEHVDAAVFREDRGQSYILFRLEDFIKRFLKATTANCDLNDD